MHWWKSSRTFLFRIFLAAFVLRLLPVLVTSQMGIGLDDMFQYDMLARSIAAGNGYRWYAQNDLPLIQQYIQLDFSQVQYDPRGVLTSFRPPLYPAFLALIYFIFGTGPNRFFIARLVQCVLAAGLAPLVYSLARKVFPEKNQVAVISAWVIVLYPMLVIYPLSLATENLFFILIVLSALTLLKAADSLKMDEARSFVPGSRSFYAHFHKARWFLLAGLLLGLTALTRSVALGMAGIAAVWIWFALRQRMLAVLTLGVTALVILPWMVRNSNLDNRLTGIESALGYDLYVGYHPQGSGTFQYPQSLDLLPMVDDGLRDSIGREKALEFIKADPARFPYLIVRRAGYFFGLERRGLTYFYSNDYLGFISTPLLYAIGFVFCLPFVVVCLSAVFGLVFVKWKREVVLLAGLAVAYILPHLVIIAEDRFHLALVPFLAVFGAYLWVGGRHPLRIIWTTNRGKIGLALACLAALLLCANWGLELWRDTDKLAQLFSLHGNQTYFPY
jgi:hypothetical protein